jgi:hypothetical protein
MTRQTLYILALTVGLLADAIAQQAVYPAKGQSPQTQKNDEAACYS